MLVFLELNLILLCLLGTAFFAGIETGIISINRLKLRPHVEEEKDWALRIQSFMDDPGRFLGTTLVGTNLCMIMGSILAASLLDSLIPKYGEFIAGSVMTVIVLVLCEYSPKAWFRAHPIDRTRRFIRALELLARLFHPFVRLVTAMTDWVARDPEGKVTRSPVMTRDDLIILTKESTENGLLTPKQRIMILRVADLSETTPPACMVPRARMNFIPAGATVAEFYAKAAECGFASLPLFSVEKNEFIGLANLYDILPVEPADSTAPVTRYLRPALFVKHNAPLTELFPLMRRARQSICLVKGPKGDVIGLLTTEDILRLVVGSL